MAIIENMNTETLLNRNELAAAMGVHRVTINRWRHDGLPAVQRAGQQPYYVLRECQAWHDEYQRSLAERKRKKPTGKPPVG